jgi:hypothetical protein
METTKIADRMAELMLPVDEQIMMCDGAEDVMMMACAMLQRVTEMLDATMGVEGRMQLLKEMANGEIQ